MSKSDEIKIGDIKFTPYKDGLAVIPHKEETTSISADEMFEKLGYEKEEVENFIIYHLPVINRRRSDNLMFYKRPKTIHINKKWNNINMQELQAINEKCKELGWI